MRTGTAVSQDEEIRTQGRMIALDMDVVDERSADWRRNLVAADMNVVLATMGLPVPDEVSVKGADVCSMPVM